jgi:hypothetical protein
LAITSTSPLSSGDGSGTQLNRAPVFDGFFGPCAFALIHISIYEIKSYIEIESRPKAKTGAPKPAKISRRIITNPPPIKQRRGSSGGMRRHPAHAAPSGD